MQQRLIVFGVDAYPPHTKSGNSFNIYALAILEESATKYYSKISKPRLIRLIHRYRPQLLAVDNVYELAPDSSSLKHLFSILPPETRVIQVTGSPKEAVTLQKAALSYGLKSPSKISSLEESEACARLATLGAGVEVQFLENETKILVCRDVSLGPGGTSQSRYRRMIHVSILTITKRIEAILRNTGIDYDVFTEASDFGLERAEFTAYTSRAHLFGLIKSSREDYIRVKVTPIYRNQIEYISRERHRPSMTDKSSSKKLILGVDPGTTCGLAILDFDAFPIYIGSHRSPSRGDVSRIVLDLGKIVVVAADVNPAPDFVVKLAKTLDAVVFTPASLLEATKKQDIAQTYARKHGIDFKDSHSRDALVAAIKAFQHYKNKFEQLEIEVQKKDLTLPIEEAKALVVRGYTIQRAIDFLTTKQSTQKEMKPRIEVDKEKEFSPEDDDRISVLQDKLSFYRIQNERLKALVEELNQRVRISESKISNLQGSLEAIQSEQAKKIRMEREVQVFLREIDGLRRRLSEADEESKQFKKRLEAMRYYKELESKGDVVFLKPVETFTKDGLEKSFQLYNIKRGDVILLLDASGGGASTSEEIVKRGVRVVIICTSMAHQAEDKLRAYDIPVIPSGKLNIEWIEGYPYVKLDELERTLKEMTEHDKLNMDKTLQEIVEEYKRERLEEVEKKA